MAGIQGWQPRLIEGLKGPNFEIAYPGPIGVNVKDGIGLSLDGTAMVIGDDSQKGTWTMARTDATPQDVITITRDDKGTHVSTPNGSMDADLLRNGNQLQLRGKHSTVENANFTTDGSHITYQNISSGSREHYDVQVGPDGGATLTGQGIIRPGTLKIGPDSAQYTGQPAMKRTANGIEVDAMAPTNVVFTPDGFTITGGFNHTTWVIKRTA